MRILIKKAFINDSNSAHDSQRMDILIVDGTISAIAEDIDESADEIIAFPDLEVSPGWVDLKADFCEPGNEHRETLESGSLAAEKGGFTHVCIVPSTNPPVDNKAQVEFITNKTKYATVYIMPIGCLSAERKGHDLAEMYDMSMSGAAYFSDDNLHINTGLLYRALLYIKNFDGKIAVSVGDHALNQNGLVNEGLASTHTGLKGNPSVSEVIDIERIIRLVEYTDSSVHLSGISTGQGVELIRKAKKNGLKITADVHANQLLFNEESVLGFDSNFKVYPPYRTESDRLALWRGIHDGTLDAIVSDHRPAHWDDKEIEFEYARFGNITLETLFPSLVNCPEFEKKSVLNALTKGPRQVINLDHQGITIGAMANLTLFSLSGSTQFVSQYFESLSRNSPFINQILKGQIFGVINNGRVSLNSKIDHG